MDKKRKILLVEDDEALGYLLSEYLKMKNFDVTWARNGEEGLKHTQSSSFDLGVFDIMMPKMDGFSLAEKIKKDFPNFPFIFLSAKSLKVDVLKGFYLGAVDYLKKPIDEEELVIRIENLLNRLTPSEENKNAPELIQIGNFSFNSINQELFYKEEKTTLTVKESELLSFLLERKNKLSNHKDILIKIWGKNDYFNKKSLNVFITRLRKYLDRDPTIKIENIHNKGYILRHTED